MMKKNSLLLIATILVSSLFAQKKEKKLVKKVFENYKAAILNDRGDEAINYLDSRTFDYYAKLLQATKRGDSITVSSLSIIDKLMVLMIRHKASNEEISSFDSKSLIVYAIKEGMVGKNSVASNTIGEVIINDSFAKGQLISKDIETEVYFNFYKEDKQWKIDLTAVMPMASIGFQRLVDESGYEENEFLYMILEQITGKKPNGEIWNPIEPS